VIKEITERIGYSLNSNKVVEIVTNSLGNLLDYDTVSYMVLEDDSKLVFKCQVRNKVTHEFIDQVRGDMLMAYQAVVGPGIKKLPLDESFTGNILDDSLKTQVESYFNLPVVISGKLVGLINVASGQSGRYSASRASVLYAITNQAATTVTKLEEVLENEKGK